MSRHKSRRPLTNCTAARMVALPSAVHRQAAQRNNAGVMDPQGREKRRALRRIGRQEERAARLSMG